MLKVVYIRAVALGLFLIADADSDVSFSDTTEFSESIQNFTAEAVEVESTDKIDEGDEEVKDKRNCTAPPNIDGIASPIISEGQQYPVGTSVNYQCQFGYVSRSSSAFLSTCEIDESTGEAEWTHPDIECVPRSCGDPGYLENGRRIGNLFTFPNRVEFECDDGYKLRGLKDRYCQAGGEWSGRLPVCEPIYCPFPHDPVNGDVLFSSLEYGTELKYECNKGYTLQNYQPRVCTEQGTWSNNEPECLETKCTVPEAPEHGTVQLSDEPKVGSIALYSCDGDTTLIGRSTSKCLSSGQWTFDTPKCMRSCIVSAVQGGELGQYITRRQRYGTRQEFSAFRIAERIKHDEIAALRCTNGFVLEDGNVESNEILCNDGMWSRPLQCQPMSCTGNPPSMKNGSPRIPGRLHGNSIWYECHPGFDKTKTGDVVCRFGKWEGPTPECTDTRCHTRQLDYPGFRKPRQLLVENGKDVQIECEDGYTVSTNEKKILCNSGKWNITVNPCTPKTCEEDPPKISNGRTRNFTRVNGSAVEYECEDNHDMAGRSSVQCAFGQWVGRPPTCELSEKPLDPDLTRKSEGTNETSVDWNESQPPRPLEECFCTFDYQSYLISARIGDKVLSVNETVKTGEMVEFSCRHQDMDIVWPTGLRMYERMAISCDVCHHWQMNDLPVCEAREPGDSQILYDSSLKILPGGKLDVPLFGRIKLQCINFWLQPNWNAGNRRDIRLFMDTITTMTLNGFYKSYMIIGRIEHEHAGKYECRSEPRFKSSVAYLEINVGGVVCPELTTNTNRGNFNIVYENDRKVNSVARYSCKDASKKLEGTSERFCQENGKWSASYPKCENLRCPLLNESNIFFITYGTGRRMNSAAFYYCKDLKQQIIGSGYRTCLHTGHWSGVEPTCEDITCLEFPTYNGLSVSYSEGLKVLTIATFTCLHRGTLIGSTFSRCLYNGTWSHPKPSCENYVTCGKFSSSLDIKVSYSDEDRVGSIATFACATSMSLVGSSWAECRPNGTWSHLYPECKAPNCSIHDLSMALPEGVWPEITDVVSEYVTAGSEIRLQCEDNLILTGNSKASCRSLGTWEIEIVQCCKPLPDVAPPLEVTLQPPESPVTAVYSCPSDFVLSGQAVRTCVSGRWTSGVPSCRPKCPILSAPANGRLVFSGSDLVEGVSAEVNCSQGYKLVGEKVLTCLPGGKWNHDLPICEELSTCPDPGNVNHADRTVMSGAVKIGGQFLQDSKIQFKCKPGFEQMGVTKIQCTFEGSWSNRLPSCIKVATIVPDCFTAGADVIAEEGIPVRIMCPPECVDEEFNLWGTSIYRTGSSVCQSAIHSAKITNSGGSVAVINNGNYSHFTGSDSNNIESESYPDTDESFRFDKLKPHALASNSDECERGLNKLENVCIYVSNLRRTFQQAKAVCTNLGLHLEIPFDLEDRSRLHAMLNAKGIQSLWAGESESAEKGANVTETSNSCPVVVLDESALISERRGCKEIMNYACVKKGDASKLAICRDPGQLDNGRVQPVGCIDGIFYVGSSIEYSCEKLYYLKGEKTISCTAKGTWSNPKPLCIKVDACSDPPIPIGGFVTYLPPLKSASAQRSAIYTSRNNLRAARLPAGLAAPIPQNLPEASTAESVTAPLPPGLHRQGTRAMFDCESRYYKLIGSRTRRCQEMGEWTGRPPICMPVCGRSDSPRSPFIWNGNATVIGQWPWQGGIARYLQDYSRWFLLCGASLLNELWVITAAHCVTYAGTTLTIEPDKFQVYLGKYHRLDSKDDEFVQVRKIQEIHIHPDYDPGLFDADIALIQLDSPVQLNSRVQPVCLPTEQTTRENLVEGKKGVVTGWGMNENETYSKILQQAVLPFVSQANCEKGYEESELPLTVTDNMFCAGFPQGRSDACSGDSGGPMVFVDESSKERKWVLEGIVSWGSPRGCGNPNQYGGFTTVSRFLDWIHLYF